jgi:hypothetical protein
VNAAKTMPNIPELRITRRSGRKGRHRLRVDIGFGVLAAVAALVLAPGLAVVAVVASLVLALCFVSLAIGRWRSRRR